MSDERPALTRRRLLQAGTTGALALAGGAGWVGCGSSSTPVPRVRALPGGRPGQQFAWDSLLAADASGNRSAPRHHRLLHLRLDGTPTVASAAALEDALRTLEEQFPAGPDGLLMTVGWGPRWFAGLEQASPIPKPVALTPDEVPDLDTFAACIHLASDRRGVLNTAERTIRRGIRSPFVVDAARRGFTAPGIPRSLSGKVEGIPAGQPERTAPLFMGFTSGFRRNQALESDVTIADGAWAGGTTMHVSVLALALSTWYGSLTIEQRAARMFSPQTSIAQVRDPGAGFRPPADVAAAAREHGLVGHAQSMIAARRNDRPLIIRRDFNGLDGRYPLVHFVSLQRDIDDFVATRRAMAAARAVAADQRVTPQINNGINEWLSTRSRANYLVPPRTRRTCPGLGGWDD